MTDSPPAPDGTDLTVTEVAERLRVSRFTVYRMLRAGQFAGSYRTIGQYRIPLAVLTAYVAQHEVGD